MIWHAPSPATKHRRIELDPQQWKQHSRRQLGGRRDCEHDWITAAEFGCWECTLCEMVVKYEHY